MKFGVPEALALAGPTASGKSAAALAIAGHLRSRFPVEIISVDSALVYRGMDIGTAKPDAVERAAIPHHLIDIREPENPYSAAEFAADAKQLIAAIQARGALPLLVGGTMLYFKALMEGLDAMPAADPLVRAGIEAEAAVCGWPAMHARLAAVDPTTAARLAPADSQRIQRALEVYRISGQPLSAFQSSMHVTTASDAPHWSSAVISLEPTHRAWLHERIAQRFDAMLQQGLLDEVKQLRARGTLNADSPAMRCVGYRQAWSWLEAEARGEAAPMALLREQGIAATRQLAKRQLTWLRGMPQRCQIACDAPDAMPQLLRAVDTRLAHSQNASHAPAIGVRQRNEEPRHVA